MRRIGTTLMVVIGVLIALVAGNAPALSQEAIPSTAEPSWVFTITFHSAELSITDMAGGLGRLTLRGIHPEIVAFTDQPIRQVSVVSTAMLGEILDSEANSAPNALLVADVAADNTATEIVMVLSKVSVDQETDSMTFDVSIMPQPGSGTPEAMAAATVEMQSGYLFIDGVQPPVEIPVNVCGNVTEPVGELQPAEGDTCVNA